MTEVFIVSFFFPKILAARARGAAGTALASQAAARHALPPLESRTPTMKPRTPSSLVAWVILLSLVSSALTGAPVSGSASAQSHDGPSQQSRSPSGRQADTQYPLLSRYATDLTRRARQGQIESNAGSAADVQEA